MARLHEHVANQRQDMLHKLSTELVCQNDIICMEDLASKNIMRNHKLARSIADVSWGGVSQTTSLQGRMVWEEGRNNRPVLPVKSALFCLWNTVAGNKRPQSTAMDLSRMWH